MLMKTLMKSVVCSLGACLFFGSASAQTLVFGDDLLVSNFFPGNRGNVNVRYGEWLATSFTTGTFDMATAVRQLIISESGFGNAETHFVAIYGDSSGAPGTEMGRFGNPVEHDPSLNLPAIKRFYPIGDPVDLAAATTYWIVFGDSANSGELFGTSVFFSTDQTGLEGWEIGNSRSRSINQGTTWLELSQPPLRFAIVPEPSETFFAIALLLCLIIAIKRIRISRQ